MADTDKKKKGAVLKRGMSEHDWDAVEDHTPTKREPFRWGIPRELQPGAPVSIETPAERTAKWGFRLRLGLVFFVVIVAFLFVLQASVQGFDANGVSMEPGLHNGDRVIVNKLAYSQLDFGVLDWAPLIDIHARWNKPSRGDVIIFKSPVDGQELVKRVIGEPGDEVTIANGTVYIDQMPLDEPYAQGETKCKETCNWHVDDDQYFVLGDNRENSLDSREGWLVPFHNIDGKKLFAY